ncbi:MAG: S-adenosylmethionine decarboxylase, partial [Thalassobaculaceae bacterium]
ISFFQMIETSNISGHLCEANGDAYIDIFSCKEYDTRKAQEIIEKYFEPAKVNLRFISRTA